MWFFGYLYIQLWVCTYCHLLPPAHSQKVVSGCAISTWSNWELYFSEFPTVYGSSIELAKSRTCMRFGRPKRSNSHYSQKHVTDRHKATFGTQRRLFLSSALYPACLPDSSPRLSCVPTEVGAKDNGFLQTSPEVSPLCPTLVSPYDCFPEFPASPDLSTCISASGRPAE